MAVRVTCEDADDGFKPTCGSIDELNFRTSPDVWGYFSVKSGGGIHEFSDSQVCRRFPFAHSCSIPTFQVIVIFSLAGLDAGGYI